MPHYLPIYFIYLLPPLKCSDYVNICLHAILSMCYTPSSFGKYQGTSEWRMANQKIAEIPIPCKYDESVHIDVVGPGI